VPAEGLLGAARLAHSLRSGPPSKTTAFNVAARRCRTRLILLPGVRIEADMRWNVILRFSDFFCGICRLRDSNKRHNKLFCKRLSRQLRRVTPKSYPARGRDIIGRHWMSVACSCDQFAYRAQQRENPVYRPRWNRGVSGPCHRKSQWRDSLGGDCVLRSGNLQNRRPNPSKI